MTTQKKSGDKKRKSPAERIRTRINVAKHKIRNIRRALQFCTVQAERSRLNARWQFWSSPDRLKI